MTPRLAAIALAGLLIGGALALALVPETRNWLGPAGGPVPTGKALVGGPFTLTDHAGKVVTEKDFHGRHALIFFGFTHCPDICPSGLQTMSAALDKLGDRAAGVTPVFVTLDPERDTPAVLAEYVKSFHPRLVGLTGTRAEIDTAIKAFRVWAKRVDNDPQNGSYAFDHSSIIYWMDPQGEFVAPFGHGTSPEKIAEQLGKAL